MSLGWRAALVLLFMTALPVRAEPPPDYESLRGGMVRQVQAWIRATGPQTGVARLDQPLLEALGEVPRHLFVPEPFRPHAYGDHPLPLGFDQNLASPFLVALMTQLAEPGPGDVIFETGTGAGYHAALLSRLAARVYSVEVIEPLALRAAETLARLGYDRVEARPGDGYYGWPEEGPYDAILVKEAVDHVPAPLLKQLKPGGRLVIPLSQAPGVQMLTLIRKRFDGSLRSRPVLPVVFSPLQGGERT